MKSFVVLIGNSDDKLSQKEWANFQKRIAEVVNQLSDEVHFCGSSNPLDQWQNMCTVSSVRDSNVDLLRSSISYILGVYNQESAAVIIGGVEFMGPEI